MGAPLNINETVVIKDGKCTPFYVKKESSFDVKHGKDSIVEEVDGDTIPTSWRKAVAATLDQDKPTIVMVMGKVDSGKTSVCTFLVNSAIKAQRKVAVIDADLGQSDIGPPTTIGLAYLNKPVGDLFLVKTEGLYFVGFTNPNGALEHIVNCISDFKMKALHGKRDFLIINTDGWVEGEDAVRYKIILTETVRPDIVVGIEQEKELAPILNKLKSTVLIVEPSTNVKKRDKERRKALRELSYKKYLRNARREIFPLNLIKIQGVHSSPNLFLTNQRLKRIEEVLEVQLVFCEETFQGIWIVLRQNQRLDFERLQRAEKVFKKLVRVMWKGGEKGLVVGLHDKESKFLGLGVLCNINYRKKIMIVHTPVTREVASIRIGRVRLDDSCREIGMTAIL